MFSSFSTSCSSRRSRSSSSVIRSNRRSIRRTYGRLQVLAGADSVDLAAFLGVVAEQGSDVDDPLALLAGDPRPVVGVRGVGEVLVLLELRPDRGEEVLALDALLPRLQLAIDRLLLGPRHDVLDDGAGVEVLEVQDLL